MEQNFGEIHKADALLRLQMWQDRCKDVQLKPGMYIQTQVVDKHGAEHPWLLIKEVLGDKIAGMIDNDLVIVRGFKAGDIVPINRTAVESHMSILSVGDIVVIKRRDFMGEPAGTHAYVYDVYPDFDHEGELGASVITENGKDLGGFSIEEQYLYIKDPVPSGYQYKFSNVIKLDQEFETLIKPLFKK